MNDVELLELAARAAGFAEIDFLGHDHLANVYDANWRQYGWNPLTDDGDALRLAVKLGITIDCPVGLNFVYAIGNGSHSESSEPDMFAATRRAIVRAAAEIGITTKAAS